jgi:hypothetical protein
MGALLFSHGMKHRNGTIPVPPYIGTIPCLGLIHEKIYQLPGIMWKYKIL